MYKTHLILKYLLKRRIAWVSLIAVMLCTTMVLVVISVMGGWLNMFKSSFRGLSADIVIHSDTLSGFPYYQEMIDAIEHDPACKVSAAVPSIETAGLYDFGNGPKPVRVMGIDLAHIDSVNSFGDSLYLQHTRIERLLNSKPSELTPGERAEQARLTPDDQARLAKKLTQAPSFDLLDEITAPLASLPPELKYLPGALDKGFTPDTLAMPEGFPLTLKNHLRFDADRKNLVYRGVMPMPYKTLLDSLSEDAAYRGAIAAIFKESSSRALPGYPQVTGKYNGLIVGTGVIGIQRDEKGVWIRQEDLEWSRPTHLTVLDLTGGHVDLSRAVTRNFFIVDDSHLGVWQYDSNYVYIDLALLQRDLGMDAQPDNQIPARVTDIHVKVMKGINADNEAELMAIRDHIQQVVDGVLMKQLAAQPSGEFSVDRPKVITWQQTQGVFISAIENEKLLMVFLFGIMCIVAIFLIFCIFYMIVVEKTRDIGIIKSVGATSAGVAGIFLGYGLVIGVIGAGAGLGLSYLLVHYINPLHEFLGWAFHVKIWNPQVYMFDQIPNQMSGTDIAWIIPIAILASVLGALIPAIRAARLNPVDSLRWE